MSLRILQNETYTLEKDGRSVELTHDDLNQIIRELAIINRLCVYDAKNKMEYECGNQHDISVCLNGWTHQININIDDEEDGAHELPADTMMVRATDEQIARAKVDPEYYDMLVQHNRNLFNEPQPR